MSYGYNTSNDLTSITDTSGAATTFGYDSLHDLTSITNTGGATTTIGYDSLHRVVAVDQQNPGAPGVAITRLDYTDGSQTLLAGPNTNQPMLPVAVPHTTYTVSSDGYDRIVKSVDPAGHTRSKTYTGFGDTASSTPRAHQVGPNQATTPATAATPGTTSSSSAGS